MPVLRMTGGTNWTMTTPGLPPMPLGEGQHLGPGDDVKLGPTTACPG
jgi:hypothetical protein